MLTIIINAIGAVYAALILLGLVHIIVHAGPIVRTLFWYVFPLSAWIPVTGILVFCSAPALGFNYLRFIFHEGAAEHMHIGLVEGYYALIVASNPDLETLAREAAHKCLR